VCEVDSPVSVPARSDRGAAVASEVSVTEEMLAVYRDAVDWTTTRFEPRSSHDWGVLARLAEALVEDETP
jgi:hypothetical protein